MPSVDARAHPVSPALRRRFEAAEKIRIGETPLRRPALRPTARSLRDHFARAAGRPPAPLENPHVEPRVDPSARERATPASVLIAVALRERTPTVLVTRRPAGISFPGHWVFPGGRADPEDATPLDTALREAEEEIGLEPARVEVLGRLGEYVSHSGFRITPTVALVHPPFALSPHPGEVDAIAEIPLTSLFDSSRYFLYRFRDRPDRAHFALEAEAGGVLQTPGDVTLRSEPEPPRAGSSAANGLEQAPLDGVARVLLTGVTVSLCIGLYAELLRTHPAARG